MNLGEIVKVVGLRGELKLRLAPDFWEAALGSRKLVLEDATGKSRPVEVVSARAHGTATRVVRLRGIEDRDAASACVGARLVLPEGVLDVPLPEALRPFQVRGMRVETVRREAVGIVEDVLQMPAQDILVVRAGERQHWIPFVEALVPEVDLEGGVVRIDPPPGLLEIEP